MLVFKRVEGAVRSAKGEVAILGAEADVSLHEQKLDLLMRIVTYTNSFEWLSHVKTREKLRAFLQSRYDYRSVAAHFGVSVKSMHVTVSYAGRILEKRIGSSLGLLEANDILAAEREFLTGIGNGEPSDLLLRCIADLFPAPLKDTSIDLSTCERELRFLSFFTRRNIDRIEASLNRRKVCYLLYILLRSDQSFVRERGILAQCIVDGELDASMAIRVLKEEFIYA